MNLFEFFRSRKNTAPVARDRLQVLLAHERSVVGKSDLLATLQEEILAVISKHISIDREAVQIKLDRGSSFSMLEIDVEVPLDTKKMKRPEAKPAAPAKPEAEAGKKPDAEAGKKLEADAGEKQEAAGESPAA